MPSGRIRLTLEYDGEGYVGWQRQPNGPSIQAEVEVALGKLFSREVRVEAAGRTDAGVHAEGQVIAFDAPFELPPRAYLRGLNGLLPPAIAAVDVRDAPEGFDPRRWARGKHYRYLVSNLTHRSPLRRRRAWEFFGPLDLEAMRKAARPLLGRHDFSAFRAADCQAAHPIRELRALDISGESGGEIRIDVEGTAFLKHMVRNLVGSLVEVGRGRRPRGWVEEVLAGRDRTRAGPTAPAHGLTLVAVRYDPGADGLK